MTSIARYKNPDEPKDVVKNWMLSKTTIEFLGLWERLHNPDFKEVEFDSFLREAGSNAFVLSPSKWIERTNAIGIISRQGNTGGTFAHKDIAFEFAAWLSAEFKLYLIKEFQHLKDEENSSKKQEWNLQRILRREIRAIKRSWYSTDEIYFNPFCHEKISFEKLTKVNGSAG